MLAAAEGLRVHTVAIGSAGGDVAMATRGLPGPPRFERHDVDTETLLHVARATGGRFFPARGSGDLEAVYREIDSLERVTRPLPARLRRTERPEPLLALAGGLLLCELTLTRVVRRRFTVWRTCAISGRVTSEPRFGSYQATTSSSTRRSATSSDRRRSAFESSATRCGQGGSWSSTTDF